MIENLRRLLEPLSTRLSNLVARATLARVDDTKKGQRVQLTVLDGEVKNDVERLQPYGLTTVPLKDAEALVLFPGGRRDGGVVIAIGDRRYRLTGLADGSVALHNHTGSRILLKPNGEVEVTPSQGQATKFVGNVEVSGTLTAQTDVVGGGKSLKNHSHSAGALTSPAGAVTGLTGGPT